jgi:hypothetical protein
VKNAEYLRRRGYDVVVIPAKHNIDVVDAIRKYELTHVVISAPWLMPFDVDTMVRHFRNIKFGIVAHSNIGFLQADPGALSLLRKYALIAEEVDNLTVGGNCSIFANWFSEVYGGDKLLLPNLYEIEHFKHSKGRGDGVIRIGTFGAIRPQKNVMTSAAAAMLVSRMTKTPVEFHVSTGREDGGGSTILSAIRQMMISVPNAELVERHWSDWKEFKRIIHEMDILFQMSYTESFNMVTADGIAEGVTSVTSDAIAWVPKSWQAKSDNVFDVASTALRQLANRKSELHRGQEALEHHNQHASLNWFEFLR